MESLLVIIIWALFGYWGSKIAEKQGRDKIVAFLLCVLFGIFGVLGYYIAGDKKVDNSNTNNTTPTENHE